MLACVALAVGLTAIPHATPLRRAPPPRSAVRMDVAILADAAGSAIREQDPHTLANLLPDLLHTTMVAAFGLAGAYVTQGTEGSEPPPPPGARVRRRRRAYSDEYLPASRERWEDERWEDAEFWERRR
ncbi:hypothetical protein AB1Y20_021744 [Prymnesium parvum]|uniref:Uncharacterized protein n=1 Tax=Prymnesium parvum TaxID=97485 RepID=A0AB34JL37_PRYPA